jgi:hypothetical protein
VLPGGEVAHLPNGRICKLLVGIVCLWFEWQAAEWNCEMVEAAGERA